MVFKTVSRTASYKVLSGEALLAQEDGQTLRVRGGDVFSTMYVAKHEFPNTFAGFLSRLGLKITIAVEQGKEEVANGAT